MTHLVDDVALDEMSQVGRRRFLPQRAQTVVARRIQRGRVSHSRTRFAKRRRSVAGMHRRRDKHWSW